MRDDPKATALLEAARRALRDELVPQLTGDTRYMGLMAANAIAIALRQLQIGDRPETEEAASLAKLRGESPAAAGRTHGELRRLNSAICADIRSGVFDPGTAPGSALHDHLWRVALQKLSESNPKALPGEE